MRRVAVVGTSIGRPEVVGDRSLEEMIFGTALATVADAGLTIDDVDAVVISANDEIDGRVISCMVTAGPAGGVNRDLTMIASASEHAFIYGYLRLLAGEGRNALVLAWGKPSESVAPEHGELVAAEPFVLRPHGMNDTIAAALQASVLVAAGDGSAPDGSGADRLVSWPLTRDDLAPQGDAVCGVLLTAEDDVPAGATPAWVRGVGWATDRYELGDRDLAAMPALGAAARRAYAMAGVDGAPAADTVRLHCPSVRSRGAALRALALEDADPRPLIDDRNGARAYPAFAAGLAVIARAAEDLRGGGAGARVAVGAALHGFAGQGAAVAVLDTTEER